MYHIYKGALMQSRAIHTFKLPHLHVLQSGSLIRNKVQHNAVLQLLWDLAYVSKECYMQQLRLLFRYLFSVPGWDQKYWWGVVGGQTRTRRTGGEGSGVKPGPGVLVGRGRGQTRTRRTGGEGSGVKPGPGVLVGRGRGSNQDQAYWWGGVGGQTRTRHTGGEGSGQPRTRRTGGEGSGVKPGPGVLMGRGWGNPGPGVLVGRGRGSNQDQVYWWGGVGGQTGTRRTGWEGSGANREPAYWWGGVGGETRTRRTGGEGEGQTGTRCTCGEGRAIWFLRSWKTDGIRGIASRKPIKSNGICGISDFLGFFNASTHRPKLYYSLFYPYLTLGSTCGVNVWSVNAQ